MKVLGALAFSVVAVNAACDAAKASTCFNKGTSCEAINKIYDCLCQAGCWDAQTEQAREATLALANLSGDSCPFSCGCFPATATVELASGKSIQMDQVKVGDKVRVGPDEFSEVYFFSTEMSESTSKFTTIVADGAEISLTSSHYLYVNGELATARSVKVGDTIVLGNGTKAEVTEVGSTWAPGLYNPHTLHGDVIVDGVKTSTYTDRVHPTLAHALLSPLRTMYSAGVSFGEGFSKVSKGLPSWLLQAISA